MNSAGDYLNPVLDYLQNGFNQVNAAQGLAIALIAAVLMKRWTQWPSIAALAALAHALIDTAVPIIAGRNALKLPPLMEPAYWQFLISLFVGYLIVTALFFAVKRVVFQGARKAAAPPPPEGKHKKK